MLDRLFGRNKDDNLEPTCAACGRTLLPGEWAQTVIADDGREEIICSLCAQAGVAEKPAAPYQEPPLEAAAPVPVSGRPQPLRPRQGRESHEESDAFWRALKDKDAQIGRLQSELAGAEAERQELIAQVSLLQRQLRGEAVTDWQAAAPFDRPAAAAAAVVAAASVDAATQPIDVPLPGPDEAAGQPFQAFGEAEAPAAEPAAQSPADTAEMAAPDTSQPAYEPAGAGQAAAGLQDDDVTAGIDLPPAVMAGGSLSQDEGPSWLFDTPPHQTFGDTALPPELRQAAGPAEEAAPAESEGAWPAQDYPPAAESAPLFAASTEAAASGSGAPPSYSDEPVQPEPEALVYSPEEVAAEAETLMLLQRGADLLNVSPAPRKISETSESLGVPMVHLSSDGRTMSAILLWSMAWYEFEVDLSTGNVGLAERGYDDRPDLQPNAKARADGTVQIAPPTRRPGAPRPVTPPPPAGPSAPVDPAARPPVPGSADIISKSLKGQRTDDEAVAWDHMAARDFDWGQ
jgi:hypothetical protein